MNRAETEWLIQFFAYTHLKSPLREVSRPYCKHAERLLLDLPRNPERTVALRKLLESKDAAVRAKLAGLGIEELVEEKAATVKVSSLKRSDVFESDGETYVVLDLYMPEEALELLDDPQAVPCLRLIDVEVYWVWKDEEVIHVKGPTVLSYH